MKKIVFTLAILIGSMTAFTATAQDKTATEKATTESTKKMDRKKAPRYNPFEGLSLTEKQQADLKALRPSKENRQKKDENKKDLSNKEKDSTKKLTAAERKDMRKKQMEQRKENRQNYLAKVKSILTPEQYVKYLENNYLNNGQKMMAHKSKMSKHHGGKSFKNGKGHKAKNRMSRTKADARK